MVQSGRILISLQQVEDSLRQNLKWPKIKLLSNILNSNILFGKNKIKKTKYFSTHAARLMSNSRLSSTCMSTRSSRSPLTSVTKVMTMTVTRKAMQMVPIIRRGVAKLETPLDHGDPMMTERVSPQVRSRWKRCGRPLRTKTHETLWAVRNPE